MTDSDIANLSPHWKPKSRMKTIALTDRKRENVRRAHRARIWAGVWRANGFSPPTIKALLRAHIDSNERLLQLTTKALKDIDGIGDVRIKEIEAYRGQFSGEDEESDGQEVRG